MRSAAFSLSMARSKSNAGRWRSGTGMCPAAAGGIELNPVGEAHERERMLGLAAVLEAALDLLAGHRAVARVVLGGSGFDALDHRATDLHGSGAEFLFHAVGAVVPGAALDRLDGGLGDQAQHVAGLEPDVLHAQVTGDVVSDLAERALEVGAQEARPVAVHEVLERIED